MNRSRTSIARFWRRLIRRPISALAVIALTVIWVPFGFAGTAEAATFTAPAQVTTTIAGCKGSTGVYTNTTTDALTDPYVCGSTAYTTGNLGKFWNELDLVPFRVTTANGRSGSTDYTLVVAADDVSSGHPGFDVITPPVVNSGGSDGSCTVTSSAQGATSGTATIYRYITIHQNQNTTCVFDYDMRLAVGSSQYPGSSLHGYLALPNTTCATVTTCGYVTSGTASVPLPVNQIQPQGLAKAMTATQGSTYLWAIHKSASPASLTFSNTCGSTTSSPTSQGPVTITLNWTRSAASPSGAITLTTNITATNPAARDISTSVSDLIYAGAAPPSGSALFAADTGSFDIPAAGSHVFTFTHTVSSGTQFNDVATGSYTDTLTGVAVPGTTSATAGATVTASGTSTGATATVTDTQQINGTGFEYSLDSATLLDGTTSAGGTFGDVTTSGSYTPGAKTTDETRWSSDTITPSGTGSASGSFLLHETGYVTTPENATGSLTDNASLTAQGSSAQSASENPVTVSLTASADDPTITINKTVDVAPTGTAADFTFSVTNNQTGHTYTGIVVTVAAGHTTGSSTAFDAGLSDAAHGGYTVTETAADARYGLNATPQTIGGATTLALCSSNNVYFTDARNLGHITVTKVLDLPTGVAPDAGGAPTSFDFAVSCPGLADIPLTVDASTGTGSASTDDVIPTGTTCTVSETTPDGAYWTLESGSPGTAQAESTDSSTNTVTVTDKRVLGGITVDKLLVGAIGGAPTTFTFHVVCPDYTGTLSVDASAGAGTTSTDDVIPTGETCTVTETNLDARWTLTSVSPNEGADNTQVGQVGVGHTVTFTNTRVLGAITVDKTLVGAIAGAPTSFTFHIVCSDYTGDLTVDASSSAGSASTGAVIPTGESCVVTETDLDSHWTLSSVTPNAGGDNSLVGQVDVPSTVAFTNTRVLGHITVVKQLASAVNSAATDTSFDFSVACPGLPAVSLSIDPVHGSDSASTGDMIPTGVVCTVSELTKTGWTLVASDPANGSATAATTDRAANTVVFVNAPAGGLALAKFESADTGTFGDTVTYKLVGLASGDQVQDKVVVTDYIPGYDPSDTTSGSTTYVADSATCSLAGCISSYNPTSHLLTWQVGTMDPNDATSKQVTLTFKVTIDSPTPAADGAIPGEVIDNVGAVASTQQAKTPSNEVTLPVTAVLGIKIIRTPPVKATKLPFTGLGLPIGPASSVAIALIGAGTALVSMSRRRRPVGKHRLTS